MHWTTRSPSMSGSVPPTSAKRGCQVATGAGTRKPPWSYRETLAFDGPQAITFSHIGERFEKMEAYDQARSITTRPWPLEPEWVDACGQGRGEGCAGRVSEAVSDLEQAVRLALEHATPGTTSGPTRWHAAPTMPWPWRPTPGARHRPIPFDGWLDHADLLPRIKGPESALAKLARGGRSSTN